MTHFCYQCGTGLEFRFLDGRMREICPACKWVFYPQLKIGAAAMIEKEGKILLAERAQDPWKGCWYLPAGYVEADENPARAVEREVKEEIGLEVTASGLVWAEYCDDDPRGPVLLLVYACEIVGGDIHCDLVETRQADYISRDAVLSLAGAGHEKVILYWMRNPEKLPIINL
jgi:8-oxo-dGTP diphosphatase